MRQHEALAPKVMSKLTDVFESGEGFYTIAEVALYARMHQNTVRAWFSGRNHPVFRKGTSSMGEGVLSFTDLVEAIYVRRLRRIHGITFPVIRTAIETAKRLKGVEHPFAHPEFRTVVVGREINIIERDDSSVMTALAPNPGQQSDITILSDFITDLEFDHGNKIIKHIAFRAPVDRVIITPNFNFGAPMMEASGYTAEALWVAYKAEGGLKQAADAYGVDEATVKAAVDYYGGVLKAA